MVLMFLLSSPLWCPNCYSYEHSQSGETKTSPSGRLPKIQKKRCMFYSSFALGKQNPGVGNFLPVMPHYAREGMGLGHARCQDFPIHLDETFLGFVLTWYTITSWLVFQVLTKAILSLSCLGIHSVDKQWPEASFLSISLNF